MATCYPDVRTKGFNLYSPDSDIYNIGLPLVAMEHSKEIIVQLNVPQSQVLIYLHMNNLIKALERSRPRFDECPKTRKHLSDVVHLLWVRLCFILLWSRKSGFL